MNYLSTIFGTTAGADTDQTIKGELSTLTSTPHPTITTTTLSSLSSISSRPRTVSNSSLSFTFSASSLPSCTSSVTSSESPIISERTTNGGYNHEKGRTVKKRSYSTSNITRGESGTMDETFKIRVSCNNCYLWRRKCKKQETKLEALEGEIARIKVLNMELTNKLNAETKGFRKMEKNMKCELEENQVFIENLQRQNEDQLKMINDMKHENEAIKLEKNELKREKEKLFQDVNETKQHGQRLLSVVNTLKEKVIKIQAQLKSEDSEGAEGFQDSQNPWYWVLKMT